MMNRRISRVCRLGRYEYLVLDRLENEAVQGRPGTGFGRSAPRKRTTLSSPRPGERTMGSHAAVVTHSFVRFALRWQFVCYCWRCKIFGYACGFHCCCDCNSSGFASSRRRTRSSSSRSCTSCTRHAAEGSPGTSFALGT